jgi:spermidine synthase
MKPDASHPEVDPRGDAVSLPLPPNVLVFLTSMSFMLVELDAGRLMSWHIGSGLYSWTTVIGVMFGGMSAGNWLGGRLADGRNPRGTLSFLLGCASAATLLLMWTHGALLATDSSWIHNLGFFGFDVPAWVPAAVHPFYTSVDRPTRLLLTASVAFLPPSILLGMISPVVARLALERAKAAGRAMGDIYAWGAVGSILGTFLAGFVLIEVLGTRGVPALTAALLAGLAVATARQSSLVSTAPGYALLFLSVVGLGAASGPWWWSNALGGPLYLREADYALCAEDSQYQHVMCYPRMHDVEVIDEKTGRPVVRRYSDYRYRELLAEGTPHRKLRELRAMELDTLVHGYVWLKMPQPGMDFDPAAAVFDPTELHYLYEQTYAVMTHRTASANPGRKLQTLSLGAGSYTFPRYLLHHYPDSTHDVAEIDAAVTRAAEKALVLDLAGTRTSDGRPSIRAFHTDARNFVEAAEGDPAMRYDVVYGDAFNHYGIPVHLVTREFNDRVRALLRPGGAYMCNVIDEYETQRFLAWHVNTLRQTFKHVRVAAARPRKSVVIAGSPDREFRVEEVRFADVTAELTDETGKVVASLPAGDVEEFHRNRGWRLIDSKGRLSYGAELRNEAGRYTLLNAEGGEIDSWPAVDVISVRHNGLPAWRLTDVDGRVYRGTNLRFVGGKVTLLGRPDRSGLRESAVHDASVVKSIREYNRVGRETFVVMATDADTDLSDFGERRGDPRFISAFDRRTVDDVTLMTDDEVERMLRRTKAGVFTDSFAPADTLLLPLFRDRSE